MKNFLLLLLSLLISYYAAADDKIAIGEFSLNRLNGWRQQQFKGQTDYRLQTENGVTVLIADSHASGSGLFLEQTIDLAQTPYLNWSWRISKRLSGLNEQSKAGDDYAARIYVVIKGGLAFWRTRAINYVWAGNSAKNTIWPNAYAGDHAMMLALRGPEAPLDAWQQEKRDVRADFKALLGMDIRYIDAVALMTDTDNSNATVSAAYGDIWFSRD